MKKLYTHTATTTLVLFCMAQMSCRENTLIQNHVLAGNDSIHAKVFTLHTLTRTYEDDSIATSTTFPNIPMYYALGNIGSNSSFFGTMNAAVCFQLIPLHTGADFSATSGNTIDSVVLILPYSGFTWGDTNNSYNQIYNVYRMTTVLSTGTDYYPSFVPDTAGPAIGTVTINTATIKAPVTINGYTYPAHARITLAADKLQDMLAGYKNWTDPATFISNFPGLCVVAAGSAAVPKALPYFQLDDGTGLFNAYTFTNMQIYYTHSGVHDSESVYFEQSSCAHNNMFARNRPAASGTNITTLMSESSSANANGGYNGASGIVALENQPGAAIDLKIYGLRSIPRSVGVPIINRAQLLLTIIPAYAGATIDTTLFPPPKLYVTGVVTVNGYDSLYDVADRDPIYKATPITAMDGYLHHMQVASGYAQTYTINLPRELQRALADNADTIHLHINGTSNFYGAYQVVIAGGNYGATAGSGDSSRDARMVVVYTAPK